MVERILVSILIPALLLLTFPHPPNGLDKPPKALARTALSTALLGSTRSPSRRSCGPRSS